MTALDAVVHVAALVLAVAGVGKLVDPGPAERALTAAGWPGGPVLARVLGLTEVMVGAAVLAVGGRIAVAALVTVYCGFVIFIVSNRARGLHIPCGCFGQSSEPPGVTHLVVNAMAVAAGAAALVWPVAGAVEWLDQGSTGVVVLLGVVLTAAAAVISLNGRSRSSGW